MQHDYKNLHTWRQRHRRFVLEEIACTVTFLPAVFFILLDLYIYFG